MRTALSPFRSRPGLLLLTAVLNAAGLLVPAAMASPVSQAWAVRVPDPTSPPFQATSMSVGPSGDVFLAGHVRRSGFNNDLRVIRYGPSGALVWQKGYTPEEGLSGDEQAGGCVAQGTNIYVVGAIGSATGSETRDVLTLKYRDTGDLEWAARWDGAGHSYDQAIAVAVDGQGNVLVLGDTTGTDVNPDFAVLKYGPAGNLLWAYSFDGPGHGPDRAVGFRLDGGGNIYVVGNSWQANGEYSIVTLKLDPGGREVWTARETSASPHGVSAESLDVDSAGNVVTLGSERYYSTTWKYDPNGNLQWLERYRAEEVAGMYAVAVRFDGSGNIITAANLYGSGVNDAVLVKYAADGQQLWATRISNGNETAHLNALDVDDDGNSYLTTSVALDVITVKVSPGGQQLWAVTFSSQGTFSDNGEFLEVTASGDIYVAGRSAHFSESFVSLVKYTQQPVAGFPTAVVTPALQVVDPGTNVVFTADTMGPEPIHIQWRMNGRPIFGATNSTFELSDVQVFHRGDYSVIVSNLAGATVSPEARLSVRTPPEVMIAPTQTLAYVGSDAAFVATVPGNEFATLQWRHKGTNVAGATNEILRLFNLNTAASGTYDIVVSTYGGTTTSSAAGLKVSSAVQLLGSTRHQSSLSTWDYAPQFRVLPNGEFLIAARSNHLTGSSIALYKHGADGGLLWSAGFESSEFTNAEPSRILLDGLGNIYVAGLSRQPNLAGTMAVLKYSPDGQLLWSRILGGTNLFSGYFHAFAVNPQGDSTIAALGSGGMTVTHYNNAGEVQWNSIDPSQQNDTISVAVDASGNTYLGTTIYLEGDNQVRLRKFGPTGADLWLRTSAEGHFNRLGALAVDAAGHLIVAGTGELAEVPDSWMFVQKFSPGGQKLWETRTGRSWSEVSYITALAVGPGDEITVLSISDDDYEFGEQSGVTRIGPDGQLRYRIGDPFVLARSPSQLALDDFGNAYVTGFGGREATGLDAVTARYDASGIRRWLVYYNGPGSSWEYSLAVGADAAGDIRVLAGEDSGSSTSADFSVLHYRQRDPAGRFRLQLIPNSGGAFHLRAPTTEPFRIEASTDLQNWTELGDAEAQDLLQPGATAFSRLPHRFFRMVVVE